MAHAAKLSELAGGLVSSITSRTANDVDFQDLRDRAIKGLKDASHARTNQFDVQAKLVGLVEKFAVLNRDDLAEGLQTRLDQLPSKSEWLPEILSLLLELSTRPVEKTQLDDVEAASGVKEQQASLTWADIIADDPLDEAEIWDDVERGYHSSDDDFTADEDGSGDETQATSFTEDDSSTLARRHVVQVDDEALNEVEAAQKNMQMPLAGQSISELTLIRESLSMLHGLPTSVFAISDKTGYVALQTTVELETLSKSLLEHTLRALADVGSSLNTVRRWVKEGKSAPTLRSCQCAVAVQLSRLSSHLAEIEQPYITSKNNSVASMADMRTNVERLTRPFVVMAKLVRTHQNDHSGGTVALLDGLYDQACIAQLSGDDSVFDNVTNVLSAGLDIYLRLVSKWIAGGECAEDEDFFVREADSHCNPGRLWHDRYTLRQNEGGKTAVPAFLRPFVARIFALGKGRAFLRALTREEDCLDANLIAESSLALNSDGNKLLPFSQVLDDAIETWITEQNRDQTPLLRAAILHEHGLYQLPETLQHIFFSKDGRRFQTLADTLFWRLDQGTRWRDSFLLTELAQTTLCSEAIVSAEGLVAQFAIEDDGSTNPSSTSSASSSIRKLEDVQLSYHIPWPLQNVTVSSRSETYSRAFTFLLQTYRAKSLLRTHLFDLRSQACLARHLPVQTQTAFKLLQRLSTIVDIFHTHFTHTSELLSIALKADLSTGENIDAMANIWQAHEQTLATSLLIADKLQPVRSAVVALFELSERLSIAFASLIARKEVEGEEVEEAGKEDEEDEEERNDASVQTMQTELDTSLSFITAGLRGIGRAVGNMALEQLAERLEWAVR